MENPGDQDAAATAYVVEDDESIRTLWRWLMESNGIAVRTFPTAPAFIESYVPGEPGCLVLDLRLPGMSGLELQAHLRSRGIELPIVFVTAHGDVRTAVKAIQDGAVDFIEKPFGYREAVAVVRKAFERDADNRRTKARVEEVARRLETLTDREHAVLRCVIAGKLNKVIADELGISVKTVEAHRAKIMEKMEVDSVAELVQQTLGFSLMESPTPRA
ncbi:MAG: response regulator transcription factor [Betaproteobacteria bacterium]|nr:response regulator transcription factor [Betaproteobacteria bacterium]